MNTDNKFYFIIEEYDAETECVSQSELFSADDIEKIKEIVDKNATVEDLKEGYLITIEEFEELRCNFGIQMIIRDGLIYIRTAEERDRIGYNLHTGRELYMMLRSEKPMSVFSEPYPSGNTNEIPEEKFQKYVDVGQFIKKEFTFEFPRHERVGDLTGVRFVIYTLKGECWRAETFILMREVSRKTGWNEALERMEGVLLGYQDWENDIHIQRWRKKFGH